MFRDRSGALLTQLEGGASYYGMEAPETVSAIFTKPDEDIRLGLIREAVVEAGRFIRNNAQLQ
jgi:hypothetical protein